MEQHIGLGHAARITGLDIWWPSSDARQHFSSVAINQFILIKEFANDYTKLDRQPAPIRTGGSASTAVAK